MPDIGLVVQGIEALKHASEILRVLRAADSALETAELKLKVAELAEAVATARLALLDAQGEIQTLKGQVADLSDDARRRLVKRDGVYFVKENGGEAGPFCPRCFEADGRRMPLTSFSSAFTAIGKYNCPQCKAVY